MYSQKQRNKIKALVRGLFKDSNNNPMELTNGQADIFLSVIDPKRKWLWLSAPTRYGKSSTLAIALIYLAVFKHLKIPIVAGSQDKAAIIMEYIVSAISHHPELYKGLINTDVSKIEQLKISVSKNGLRWVDGGWIYITSIESRSVKKEGEGVVGEGGDVVVLEEAGLIKNDEQFSKIVRMPEENKGWGKLIMSGNCIENSVFEKAFNNPLYHKVRIGLEQAIAEGRFTQRSLDEKRGQTTSKDWKRYYEVLFPLANEFTYFKPKKYEILPRDLEYYGAIDPSLGETEKSSKQAIIVIGLDRETGKRYEVESIIEQIGPNEAMTRIFNLPYKFKRFGFEAVAFQKYFLKQCNDLSMKLGINIPFEGIPQVGAGKKNERIESLEPYINTEQLLFKGGNQLWEDMAEYPKAEFLDGLDALEMAYRISNKKKPSFGFGDDMY